MPLHIADEEEDLFPAFARHCAGEAEFEGIRTQLCKEHAPDDPLTRILEADLQILAAGGTLKDHAGFAAMACSFAEMQERHLNWENNTVLPLAEKCLDAEELREIGRSMVAETIPEANGPRMMACSRIASLMNATAVAGSSAVS